jgi:RNA polymerase sigma-70 factor (ECF subfamily)
MTTYEFKKHFSNLYLPLAMYALRIVGDTDLAQDVVQDAFENAWLLISNSSLEVANFKAYIYRAVRNIAISQIRQSVDTTDIDGADFVSDEDIDTSERDALLWQAIDNLPKRCRQVFLLSKRDGLSNQQIADRLDISVKTVENQMTKAYKALRANLNSSSHFFLPFL